MRFLYAILFVFASFGQVNAQMHEPVKWTYSFRETGENEGEVVLRAVIDNGWHLNSTKAEEPFLPQVFSFEKSNCYSKTGKIIEPKPHKEFFDDIMQAKSSYFEKEVEFRQKIKLNTPDGFTLKADLEGSVCTEEGMCIIVKEKAEVKISGTTGKTTDCKNMVSGTNSTENQEAILPEQVDVVAVNTEETTTELPAKVATGSFVEPQKLSKEAIDSLPEDCGNVQTSDEHSYWGIFIGGFLGGFLALLTPCVFPMIPLTVSFFTKRSQNRAKGVVNAFIYALSIIVIYTSLGFIVSKVFGAEVLNQMSTNVWFNLAFFVIFIVFAISFFGVFEITLPSGLVNKAAAAENRGGLIGIFFMAFTLSLVSFSCTGPIIGTLLVEAATGGSHVGPLVGMFGFSLALALPFALFAAFPGILQSLPKSGGWLNSVKISLGFIELALALKFLSNVDMAYHWGFLKREVFLAIWIVIFTLLGFYLLGKIKFKSDTDTKDTSVTGLLLGILTFSFVMYLVPGMWGAPLRLISGFPPPIFYSEWKEGGKPCPEGFDCEHDYMAGVNRAVVEDKPIMLDFTGWGCTNCRRMEENVWVKPEVKKLINEYVLVSLYCDDKEKLATPFQIGNRIAETEGEKWSYFQQEYYNNNAQPFYVLIDTKGRLLSAPGMYNTDAVEYAAFLREGLCRYKKLND